MSEIRQLNQDLPELTQFYSDDTPFRPIEADEDGIRAFRTIAASDKPTTDFRRILKEGLPVVASDLSKKQPMMVNHYTYGPDALPIGKTISGKYIKKLEIVESDFYLDDADYTARILSGIDKGSIDMVSIGADGKFKCSFDGSPMGFFGCRKSGHYRGQEIMLDKDGNETDEHSERVRTVFIYANFLVRLVDELSIVYKGAVQDANIIKKYHHDPAQNQAIVEAVRSVYDKKQVHEYELERLCASYGGLGGILKQSRAPVTVPVITDIGGDTTMADQTITPEVKASMSPEIQAIIENLETSNTKLSTDLATAQETIESYENNSISSDDITAKDDRITTLEASEKTLKDQITEHEAKSEHYDSVVTQLRIDLEKAKRESGASEEDLASFAEQVAKMGDALNMFLLYKQIKDEKSGNSGSYSRIITVQNSEANAASVDSHKRASILSAFG